MDGSPRSHNFLRMVHGVPGTHTPIAKVGPMLQGVRHGAHAEQNLPNAGAIRREASVPTWFSKVLRLYGNV